MSMKHITALTVAICLAMSPATAFSDEKGDVDEGLSLMEKGATLLFRGLMTEMEPALNDLKGMAEEMGPALTQLQGMIGDFTNFHAPEALPNGDIILRRKDDPLPPPEPPAESPPGEVEL